MTRMVIIYHQICDEIKASTKISKTTRRKTPPESPLTQENAKEMVGLGCAVGHQRLYDNKRGIQNTMNITQELDKWEDSVRQSFRDLSVTLLSPEQLQAARDLLFREEVHKHCKDILQKMQDDDSLSDVQMYDFMPSDKVLQYSKYQHVGAKIVESLAPILVAHGRYVWYEGARCKVAHGPWYGFVSCSCDKKYVNRYYCANKDI